MFVLAVLHMTAAARAGFRGGIRWDLIKVSLEIWTGVAWAKGGYGGWAHVRFGDGEPQGAAGGDGISFK